MPSTKMNIPKTITVGYLERKDTYTGKLAYVIYTDHRGKLRKEYSWNNWRDKKIEADTYSNEPTSGFVLNKGVGGARQSYGWNARNEYIRVYDPRGFEFEISVANLLFILQECTSTKGKGLEGEFIYSWDRKDLVLLPVCSNEYVECAEFTAHQSTKVTKNDMVEGCSYLMKDMTEVMYLGRHDYYEPENDHRGRYLISHKGKHHIFLRLSENPITWRYDSGYILQKGFTKLAKKISDEVLPQYADEYDRFKMNIHGSPVANIKVIKRVFTKTQLSKEHYWEHHTLLKKDGGYTRVRINRVNYDSLLGKIKAGTFNLIQGRQIFSPSLVLETCYIPTIQEYGHDPDKVVNMTEEEVLKQQFYTTVLITKNGGSYDVLKNMR